MDLRTPPPALVDLQLSTPPIPFSFRPPSDGSQWLQNGAAAATIIGTVVTIARK